MEGILRCSRYAFGPNRLHYCGPDANSELKERIEKEGKDWGLAEILKQFKTLYPYLTLIAQANKINDPFDDRVVSAYWLGNSLLANISKRRFFNFLKEDFSIHTRAKPSEVRWLIKKVELGALPHHSFHVLNVWKQANKDKEAHLIESLSECIVNFGRVTRVEGATITVKTKPLIYQSGQFQLGALTQKKINRMLQATYDIEQLKEGQMISYHWSVPCEVITLFQARSLQYYTQKNIDFINQTI